MKDPTIHPIDITMIRLRRCKKLLSFFKLSRLYIIILTTNRVNWDTLFISGNQEHAGQFIKSLNYFCRTKCL